MKERNNQTAPEGFTEKRLLDAKELCYYLSLGRNRALEFAKSIGSEVKFGKRCLYDKRKIDLYLDEMTEIE
ncbi:hypothetical protein [Clostridium sp. HBUAS56010]|uniref:hypothetical protein n=1 Tax=Clostridium sp. HBUAS56010 TaxID=2571127 RepID=UPI00117738AD|nr:hypothetical protein [Clostridium sp. HBUAS56010]